MRDLCYQAHRLVRQYAPNHYTFGNGSVDSLPAAILPLGPRVAVVLGGGNTPRGKALRALVETYLGRMERVTVVSVIPGSSPNTPRDDVERIAGELLEVDATGLVAVGGGSTIDSAKAALALATLTGCIPDLETLFGTGLVTRALALQKRRLIPLLAVQTAAGSAAHLTRYANVTNISGTQKNLIVDDALIPPYALFDYQMTCSAPASLTADGAMDGLSHLVEVYVGGSERTQDLLAPLVDVGLRLIIREARNAMEEPENLSARQSLGLATDLGGIAIMQGGTSGPHLVSFSLVDIASHGRACGLLNPYFLVFFAPRIASQLRTLGAILEEERLLDSISLSLPPRGLALGVARAILDLVAQLGLPTRLADIAGFSNEHIRRAVEAAKRPSLAMKLQNMPVPMFPEEIDQYLPTILGAATSGDLESVPEVSA